MRAEAAAGSGGGAPALRVADLRCRYGDTVAVDGVSFDVGAHEVVCLVGPSGCGKSSALRAIAGLLHPASGTVHLADEALDDGARHVPTERRGIGIVFQEHALFPNLKVAANVAFGLRRWGRTEAREQVAAMLELVGLADLRDRYPHELSGGERQRIALARALAPDPSVLLLDEPFASLDHNLRVQVRDEVSAILRATGTPAVFVTHDHVEALALADRIVVLRAGRVEQQGTPVEVFHRPANRFVARFFGEADFLPATVHGDVASTELGAVAVPAGTADGGDRDLLVRPEDVAFESGGTEGPGVARVQRASFQGSSVLYELALPSGQVVRSRQHHLVDAPVGATVAVTLASHTGAVLLPR